MWYKTAGNVGPEMGKRENKENKYEKRTANLLLSSAWPL